MFDHFTERARKSMTLARQAAQRFHHDYIGTEHMLLGIVGVDDSVGAQVLRDLNVDAAAVRAESEKIIKSGTNMAVMGQLPFTPRGKRVLELSLDEARGLGHDYIGTEHLLLGLVAENEGIAAQILIRGFGLNAEQIRAKVVERVPANPDAVLPPLSAAADGGARNPFRRLGFLGLLGLLGFVDARLGYLGFLGFLGFLGPRRHFSETSRGGPPR